MRPVAKRRLLCLVGLRHGRTGKFLVGPGYTTENAPAGTELRGADTDSRAIAQLVDLVEHVHEIEPQRELRVGPGGELADEANVDRSIGRKALGVGEAAPQAAAIEQIGIGFPMAPPVGGAQRSRVGLIVIEMDFVGGDIVQLVLAKLELSRDDLPTGGARNREVGEGRE